MTPSINYPTIAQMKEAILGAPGTQFTLVTPRVAKALDQARYQTDLKWANQLLKQALIDDQKEKAQ